MKKNCLICGKIFFKLPTHSKNRWKLTKFCSRKCYFKYGRPEIRGEKHWFWKNKKIKMLCDFCGKEFENYLSNTKYNKNKFCSRNCLGKYVYNTTGKVGRSGEKTWNWKGDKVGYFALHTWVKRWKPKPKACENCEEIKRLDVANISGKYKRDLSDYWYLCRACHIRFDAGEISYT